MRKTGIQNPEIQKLLTQVGHTQYIVVADVGLPVQEGVKVIDLSVGNGFPDFMDVLKPVAEEFAYEKYLYAREMEEANPALLQEMQALLGDVPFESVSHEDFKKMIAGARGVIRTGATRSYANVILVGGVTF